MSMSAATVPSPDRLQAIVARIGTKCELPPLPAVSQRALQLIQSQDTTAEAMATLVATDAALAARVVRIARSPVYLRRQPPRTLRDAILTVGFNGLRQILLAASVRSIFTVKTSVASTLWQHSLATALAADDLAKQAGGRGGGDAFLAGLMHEVGSLVFFLVNPTVAAELPEWDPEAEEARFGATHPSVAAALAHAWGMDEGLVAAVYAHHDETATGLAAVLRLADQMADVMGRPTVRSDEPPTPVLPEAVERRLESIVDMIEAHRLLFE